MDREVSHFAILATGNTPGNEDGRCDVAVVAAEWSGYEYTPTGGPVMHWVEIPVGAGADLLLNGDAALSVRGWDRTGSWELSEGDGAFYAPVAAREAVK